jgi:hypothetical protein
MRPRGSYGEVAQALLASADNGPGQVRQLAQRAQVGYAAARVSCSRLVARGELVVLDGGRPAVLARPHDAVTTVDEALADLERAWQCQALA